MWGTCVLTARPIEGDVSFLRAPIIGEEGTITWDYFGTRLPWFRASVGKWKEKEYSEVQRNDRFLKERQHVLACSKGERSVASCRTRWTRVLLRPPCGIVKCGQGVGMAPRRTQTNRAG